MRKAGGRGRSPLGAAFANAMRTHAAALAPAAHVFKLCRKPEALVKAWRADLAVARGTWLGEATTPKQSAERERSDFLQYVDSAGRYADVHALRTTFATNLIAAGVDVKTAQALLGHASAVMTLDVYAKVFHGSDEAAIARLPSYEPDTREAARREGTHDAPAHCRENCRELGSKPANPMHAGAVRTLRYASAESSGKQGENCTSAHEKSPARTGLQNTPPTGFEPVLPA